MNPEIAKIILAPAQGFHTWDFPAGKSNLSRRKTVVEALLPELKGPRGSVPTAKATVQNYKTGITKSLKMEKFEPKVIRERLNQIIQQN